MHERVLPGRADGLFEQMGSRIIYDRKFLLDCRSSPVARTPPRCLPDIPGVTSLPSTLINNEKATPPLQSPNSHCSPPADKTAGEKHSPRN
ncbi:hypothetical protein JZ751_026107 [Albula glossodonta]|uniref:Eukaryotic translation initiation factor 4E binding protein 1 n=1 Tax=Albula glossodonta TaxID=121402 RepID=A0A8T2MRG6_9TELE|nr:hypothetical protein JZ751_026107 [Albula glossodonta]